MKKIGLLIVVIISMSSCVSKKIYNDLENKYTDLKKENHALADENEELKKAKSLQANHDINVWPKKPIKENFEFEIIKVDSNIQNIQLNSYASTQNDPTFYWPFAVFLDQNACVLEGVGGFKNDENSPSMLSHEMIAGILHVPEQSHYLLLTPLSSAVDVEHKVLTNHGQLKLIAIR